MDVVEGGLDNIELFAGLPADAIREIARKATWSTFRADEQVFDKNTDSLDVYFVVRGSVRILGNVSGEREVSLADVNEGNYFGELAAIDRKERSARVVAAQDCVLASLDGPAFLDVMMRHPVVALRVMERFTRIIRALDNRVTDLSTLSEVQRIYVELCRLAKPDPRRPAGWHIPDMPNHKEIASWAGTSREAVAQAIGELARDGILERRSMSLVIHDFPRLQTMARAGEGG